jgi:hypothetical protein
MSVYIALYFLQALTRHDPKAHIIAVDNELQAARLPNWRLHLDW